MITHLITRYAKAVAALVALVAADLIPGVDPTVLEQLLPALLVAFIPNRPRPEIHEEAEGKPADDDGITTLGTKLADRHP